MGNKPGKKFWEIKNVSEQEAEIVIYGPIFNDVLFEEEVSPKLISDQLKELGDIAKITVRINSPGGDVFASQAILSILKSHRAEVVVRVDGLAASGASLIAMAGDTIIMPRNSMMMVHNPLTISIGNSNDFRKLADDLDKIRESMLAAYEDKSGMDTQELIKMLDEETWLTAEEAISYGLADQIDEENLVAASLKGNTLVVNGHEFDISKFNKKPPVNDTGTPAGFYNTRSRENVAATAHQPPGATNPTPGDKKPAGKKEDPQLEIKTVEELKQHYPDLVAQAEQAAKEDGAKEERERIKGIDEISNTVSSELLHKAKYEEPMTAEKLAFEALKADSASGARHLENLDADADESKVNNIQGDPQEPQPNESKKKDEEQRSEAAQGVAEFAKKRRGK